MTGAALVTLWPASRIVEALDLVTNCPHRGSVLPHPKQTEGCGCGEKTECRHGEPATLADCLRCVTGQRPR